jgi:hypothetical protein
MFFTVVTVVIRVGDLSSSFGACPCVPVADNFFKHIQFDTCGCVFSTRDRIAAHLERK